MQKTEAQQANVQSQPAVRQGKGASLESPQDEQIAQLEAMIESSPQMETQAQLAAAIDASPAQAAQRRMMAGIVNSPRVTAQRQTLASVHNSPVQRVQGEALSAASGEAVQRKETEAPLQSKPTQRAEAPAQLRASIQLTGREGDELDPGPGQGEQAPPTPRPGQGGQERPSSTESGSLAQDGYSPRAGEERDETAQLVKAGASSQLKVAQFADAPVKPNNTGLPDNLKSGIESLSGMSMDSVKVHYNSSQPAQLNALAYAQGTDIHVAPGQEQHLPHEAWHVVQQAQGRVRPTMQMKDGVPVNDDAGLESEADLMGGKALAQRNAGTTQLFRHSGAVYTAQPGGIPAPPLLAAMPVFRPSLAQRRLSDPVNLGAASAVVVNGARTALVETALDIYRSGGAGQLYVTGTLGLRTTRTDMTTDVSGLDVDNLRQMIVRVRNDHPDQVFDSANFDVKPTVGSQGEVYVTNLVVATLAKMQSAANNDMILRSIFGDGDPGSVASQTAAATARTKIQGARTRLNLFLNIYIDTSGVSRRVGIGGYANFDQKIFLLVADVNAAPTNAAISTLFHESMHLAHAEIRDEGGYSSTGTRFSGAQIQEKLTNADHYAEVAKVLDGETTHALPFSPAAPNMGVPAAPTNPADTDDTMAVRNNVMHRCRQLWSGAADYFMKAVRDKRNNDDWWNRNDTSKKLNMTYHNTKLFDTPQLNETDLSLAEGSVNRIHRFTASVTAKMKNAADEVFTFIRDTYTAATGTGDGKQKQAGKDVLVEEGTGSDILAPQDKTPSVAKRFDSISR